MILTLNGQERKHSINEHLNSIKARRFYLAGLVQLISAGAAAAVVAASLLCR